MKIIALLTTISLISACKSPKELTAYDLCRQELTAYCKDLASYIYTTDGGNTYRFRNELIEVPEGYRDMRWWSQTYEWVHGLDSMATQHMIYSKRLEKLLEFDCPLRKEDVIKYFGLPHTKYHGSGDLSKSKSLLYIFNTPKYHDCYNPYKSGISKYADCAPIFFQLDSLNNVYLINTIGFEMLTDY